MSTQHPDQITVVGTDAGPWTDMLDGTTHDDYVLHAQSQATNPRYEGKHRSPNTGIATAVVHAVRLGFGRARRRG